MKFEMSIDAKVSSIQETEDGYELILEDRDSQSPRGQCSLLIENLREQEAVDLAFLVGCEIWGNSSVIMLGDSVIADRISYTKIRMKPLWADLLIIHKSKKIRSIPR